MSYGVVSMAHVTGRYTAVGDVVEQYTTDARKLRGWRYRGMHRADPGVGLTDLAVEAGTAALERAGIRAEDVHLVVLAISDIAEYLYWDAAAATQARLGARNAEAVLISQACASGVLGFDAVAGKFATHPEYRTALIIGSNRITEEYWNRMESSTCVTSDGAAAAVAVRGHDRCRWLATEVITDGRYADLTRMDVGGTARPFTASAPEPGRVLNPVDRVEAHFGGDTTEMLAFAQATISGNRDVLERACKRAGVAVDDVRRVIHVHDNMKALIHVAAAHGIPLEHTNAELAMEHGHFGCADQIFGLEKLTASGELRPGDVVALCATGGGMHWACTLLRL